MPSGPSAKLSPRFVMGITAFRLSLRQSRFDKGSEQCVAAVTS